jgi:uncharacterized membrane protein
MTGTREPAPLPRSLGSTEVPNPWRRSAADRYGRAVARSRCRTAHPGRFLLATGRYLLQIYAGAEDAFRDYRRGLGRTLLLGIEILIAGDLVRTVAVHPTLESVLSLAVIVLIRTLLSISIQVELDGRWPWQRSAEEPPPAREPSQQ